MSSSNLGYLYYKKYYDEIIKDDKYYDHIINKSKNEKIEKDIKERFNEKNKSIIDNSNFDKVKKIKSVYNCKVKEDDQEIFLKTTYPGLLIGSGYSHIISEKGEFKLGLEFDYTTGLPVINGSSVKGLLRSTFYNAQDEEVLQESKKEYINGIIKNLGFSESFSFKDLTEAIFDGKVDGKNIPICERDIFYDAMIDVEGTEKTIGDSKNILGEDFITPHKDVFKNPIPLKFLKIMPNVVWCFRFNLKDKILPSNIKRNIFKQIILDFGIGAKTNVGYGQFEVDKNYEKKLKENELKRKKELEKIKNLKAEEEFNKATLGMSEFEKELYKIEQSKDEYEKNDKIMNIYNERLDALDTAEKVLFARFFKEYLLSKNKWKYKISKKGKIDKTSEIVGKICNILKIPLPTK